MPELSSRLELLPNQRVYIFFSLKWNVVHTIVYKVLGLSKKQDWCCGMVNFCNERFWRFTGFLATVPVKLKNHRLLCP